MEDQQPVQPTYSSQRSSVSFPGTPQPKKKNIGLKIGILLALLLLIGGIAWFLMGSESPFTASVPSPTPTVFVNAPPTEAPIPTEAPAAIADLQAQALNGTGVPGEASFLESELKKLGFTQIETGNADNSSYTRTEVAFSSKVTDDIKAIITSKLQELYATVAVSDAPSAGVDVKIITGPRKGARTSPAPTTSARTTATPTKASGSGTPTKAATGTPTPTKAQ